MTSAEVRSPDVRICSLGEVELRRYSDTAAEFSGSDNASFIFLFFISRATLTAGGPLPSGPLHDALVILPGEELARTPFAGPADLVCLRLHRSTAEAFVPDELWKAQVFTSLTRLDHASREFIRAILEYPKGKPRSSIEDYASEQVILELAGSLLLDHYGSSWEPNSPSSVLRDQAMAVIAQRCADKELNPEAVAKAVQSSLRRVQAAFAEVGNSIAAEIRRQRGRLAKALLTDGRYDVLSVQQVAEHAGFSTTAALRRALDELYGCGPRELRDGRG